MRRVASLLLSSAPLLLLSAALCGCSRGEPYRHIDGAVWNTTYSIIYQGSASLADSVPAILREVEMSLSPFNPGSLISRINRGETDSADARIARVFDISRSVNALSGGAFDPTLSPLINLWGFGYDKTAGADAVPSDSAIVLAMQSVGMGECRLDGGKVVRKSPSTTFNFSAVTKGYGCDLVAAKLSRNGVDNYMVEIGGEIAIGGVNDRGRKWIVMIEAPRYDLSGRREGMMTVDVTDCGIATSGNYHNYHDTSAGRVGHTISATTGRPVVTPTLSATVIAPDCATADALATAAMAMQPDSALAMLESLDGVTALIVTADTTITTTKFP